MSKFDEKAREFWVETEMQDPSKNAGWKFHRAWTGWFEMLASAGIETVHVIEKSAYDKQAARIAEQKSVIDSFVAALDEANSKIAELEAKLTSKPLAESAQFVASFDEKVATFESEKPYGFEGTSAREAGYFVRGARWQHSQLAARIAELEAENKEHRDERARWNAYAKRWQTLDEILQERDQLAEKLRVAIEALDACMWADNDRGAVTGIARKALKKLKGMK